MTRFVMGDKPGLGGVVKIVKNNALDPMLLDSIANANEFIFDSEKSRIGYTYGWHRVQWNPAFVGSDAFESRILFAAPSVSDPKYGVAVYGAGSGRIQYWFLNTTNLGIPYSCMVESRYKINVGTVNERYNGPTCNWRFRGDNEVNPGRLYQADTTTGYGLNGSRPMTFEGVTANFGYLATRTAAVETTGRVIGFAWDLPADETPLPTDGVSVPGQQQVLFSPTLIKIMRPGRDISSTTLSDAVLDSQRIPAKLLAYGVTSVDDATTVTVPINTPFPLTEDCYVDFHCREQGENAYTSPFISADEADLATVWYRIDPIAKTITWRNQFNGFDVDILWMLLADDPTGITTGGERVMSLGNDGTQDYVQIKRPGSSDVAPSLRDIMLDSRLPTLKIMYEGWIPYTDFSNTGGADLMRGSMKYTLNMVNDGTWLPLVKHVMKWTTGFIRGPIHQRWYLTIPSHSTWHNKCTRRSSLARVFPSAIEFYMNRNNPTDLEYDFDDGNIRTDNYDRDDFDLDTDLNRPIGIRYYVFAIPTT